MPHKEIVCTFFMRTLITTAFFHPERRRVVRSYDIIQIQLEESTTDSNPFGVEPVPSCIVLLKEREHIWFWLDAPCDLTMAHGKIDVRLGRRL
jgi:hypothetical protein